MTDTNILADFDKLSGLLSDAKSALCEIIFGQDDTIALCLVTLAAGGHGLLVGAPGLAKTLLVTSISGLTGLSAKRVQFTPDLMPGDVLGSEVLDQAETGKREFRFIPGPIFCQLLMADEINRASPRTQSALLQAMQEHHVTIAGERHNLPDPFHVLATQNPIEQEGTYPLPEAQLDRFLMQINISYPDEKAERKMLAATTGETTSPVQSIMVPDQLKQIQQLVRAMPISERIVDTIISLVRGARPIPGAREEVIQFIEWGPGPRASQALSLAVRALALTEGRHAPSLEDVERLAAPVLRHRMALSFSAKAEAIDLDTFISELTSAALQQS